MLTLTTVITGGQWFLPALILILIFMFLSQYAEKKQKLGLSKNLRRVEYAALALALIIIWIVYAQAGIEIAPAAFLTTIIVQFLVNQFLDSKRQSLQSRLGKKYGWLRFGFDLLMIIILGIIMLIWFNHNPFLWIIIGLLLVLSAWMDFSNNK